MTDRLTWDWRQICTKSCLCFIVSNTANKPLICTSTVFCCFVDMLFSYSLQPFEHPYCTDKGVIFDIV